MDGPRIQGATRKLDVSVRQVHTRSGGPSSDMSVQCPTIGCTMVVDERLECRSWSGLYLDRTASGSYVLCAGDEPQVRPALSSPAPERPRIGELPIRAIMTREVACVRPELGLAAAARLLVERGISGAPVLANDDPRSAW